MYQEIISSAKRVQLTVMIVEIAKLQVTSIHRDAG